MDFAYPRRPMLASSHGPRFAGVCFAALAALQLAGCAPNTTPRPRAELNAKFVDPDVDVDHWTSVFEGESREVFQKRVLIVDALDLRPGMHVADIGAGSGLFLELLADRVGSEGRVYAVEIAPRFVEHMRERAAAEGLDQVETVQNDIRSTGLPDGSVDAVFLCDVYHHFEHPQEMLGSIRRTLRPGGLLLVVDPHRIPGKSRPWLLRHVRIGKEDLAAEIVAAGFVLEEEVRINGLEKEYVLRFRRP